MGVSRINIKYVPGQKIKTLNQIVEANIDDHTMNDYGQDAMFYFKNCNCSKK